ncbi:hypothetical protein MYIN104542_29555 [Mycobacterium intermedium]
MGPKFPKPEALPLPELKKPDDGVLVVFPKPGFAGMSSSRTRIGPAPLRMEMGIEMLSPPMETLMTGRMPLTGGMKMGPMPKLVMPMALIVMRGSVNPLSSRLPRLRLIGMLIGMLRSKASTENSGMLISVWVPHRPW